jgi:hypothetical protein
MKLWAAALLLLAACGAKQPTVIDGSSPEAFERTTEAARRDLPDAERLDYDAALKSPPGTRYGDTPAERDALAREVYNGMTARQVVDQ